jgi:hypothetical protein
MFVAGAFASSPCYADPPGVRALTAPLVSPSTALSWYQGQGTTHTTGGAAWSGGAPEIVALARSLGADRIQTGPAPITATQYTENVFNYVRNNIEIEFTFGLSKGARGALLDQRGNPFDHAELMLLLLNQGGVSAQLQVGTVALTGRQFGYWSGLVRDLAAPSAGLDPYVAVSNPSAQSFQVDARGACELLAHGGMPASFSGGTTCASLSGNLSATSTAVTLAHVWVVANGQIYDPSLKLHTLTPRMDVPSMMGCGTWAASTCGQATDQLLSGASASTLGGAPTLGNVSTSNWSAVISGLFSNASNLQHAIEAVDRSLRLVDVLGGKQIFSAEASSLAAQSSAYSTSGAAWSAMPDAYRTKLTLQPPDDVFGQCTLFADEVAGRSLVFSGRQTDVYSFTIDGTSFSPGQCNTQAGPPPFFGVRMIVDHPYFANSQTYGDETLDFELVEPRFYKVDGFAYDETSDLGSLPITIVHNFGQAGPNAASGVQETWPTGGSDCVPNSMAGLVTRTCHIGTAPQSAETIRYNARLVQDAIAGVTGTAANAHHQLGVVYASRKTGSAYMTLSTSVSFARTKSEDTTSTQRALELLSYALPSVEGNASSSNPFSDDPYRPFIGPATPTTTSTPLIDVSPSQMSAVLAALPSVSTYPSYQQFWETRRRTRLQAAANAGYSVIFNQTGHHQTGELFYRQGEVSYTFWQTAKGATISDPFNPVMNTAQINEEAAARRQYLSVSPADGELRISAPPDIVSGAGEFPYALPFSRTYVGGARERRTGQGYTYYDGPTQTGSGSTSWEYTGIDNDMAARLGGGWTHNFNVSATMSQDFSRGLGAQSATEASFFITLMVTLNDTMPAANLQSRVRAIALLRYMPLGWTFVVKKGSSSEAFFLVARWAHECAAWVGRKPGHWPDYAVGAAK